MLNNVYTYGARAVTYVVRTCGPTHMLVIDFMSNKICLNQGWGKASLGDNFYYCRSVHLVHVFTHDFYTVKNLFMCLAGLITLNKFESIMRPNKLYSRPSMAGTLMARLPRLFRTRS